jgi:DNA-binding transcriptional LysR family regulator
LSNRLGVELTVADGRGIRLTSAGRQLATSAVAICRQLELAERELDEGGDHSTLPTVSIATFATVAEHLVPDAIDRLGSGVDIQVSIAELPADLAVPGVISGTYDIAIVRTFEPGTFVRPTSTVAKVIATEPLDLVARPQTEGRSVTLSSLADAPWISGPLGSTLADAIESTCRTVGGFTPNVVHRVSDAAVTIRLAELGLGVGLLPRLSTRGAPERLIHATPGAVARSLIAVCLPDSLDHHPVRELWDALGSQD